MSTTLDPLTPDHIALAAEIPLHLREPRTYPEAQGLAALAAALVLGEFQVSQGALLITGLFPSQTCPGGAVVTWQGRPVLVAPEPGDVWLFYPGEWETALTALARQRDALSTTDAPTETRACEETSQKRRTNVEEGQQHIADREQAQGVRE